MKEQTEPQPRRVYPEEWELELFRIGDNFLVPPALPPDLRKGFAFSDPLLIIRGEELEVSRSRGKPEAFRTSGGTAANSV